MATTKVAVAAVGGGIIAMVGILLLAEHEAAGGP
jgi:hypothetical protein